MRVLGGVVEVLMHRAVGHHPWRDERRADAGAGRGIGILAGDDIDAGLAGFVDQRDHLRALPPHIRAERLDVRDHHRQVRLAADTDGLLHRSEQADGIRTLVAHMRVVYPVVLRGNAGQFDHLFRARITPRRVIQAGREANRALAHCTVDQRLHAVHLFRRRLGVGHAHHFAAHGPLADEEDRIGANSLLAPLGERGRGIEGAGAIVSRGDGGDALHQIRLVAGVFRVGKVCGGVGMRVDKAGSDDQAGCVDGALGGSPRACTHEDDAVGEDADVGRDGRRTGAVDYRAAADEEIELLGVDAGTDQRKYGE